LGTNAEVSNSFGGRSGDFGNGLILQAGGKIVVAGL
jgi:hypothetical protein